ncbi:MAG TPA: metallophosphoesterase [Candidatus Dormibacteraeota bacterium]|nr:metallophosphoesterase [Candidatus Dormibacteraeota bacterium]
MTTNLQGGGGRLFADPRPSPDPTTFQVDNTSDAYYSSPYFKLHQSQLQPVPAPFDRAPAPFQIGGVLDDKMLTTIEQRKKITFHSVGDTGAAKVNRFQTAAHALANEEGVADRMAKEIAAAADPASAPAFFFHLGDIVYYFGEAQYYYDQFYEPFRGYDRPIFAVPGNHDGAVGSAQMKTMDAFLRNFCAPAPGPSPDAGTAVRSVMTQPGPYFTLEAPLVSVIGLYTNVLEWPGVISSQKGAYPAVSDNQLQWLTSELTRLKPARDRGERAVLIAMHHPAVSVDSAHGGTSGLSQDIDAACVAAGLWPDAVLAGHAHLYQQFTRSVDGVEIPYVVAGSGGYAATPPKVVPKVPYTTDGFTLAADPLVDFGYLNLGVDLSAAPTLTIDFRGRRTSDHVSVDLVKRRVTRQPGP